MLHATSFLVLIDYSPKSSKRAPSSGYIIYMESAPANKGKKSLFTCFKSSVGIDDETSKSARRSKGDATNDPVLAYLAVADEDGVVLSSAAEDGWEECRSRRRKRGRDRCHVLRAAALVV